MAFDMRTRLRAVTTYAALPGISVPIIASAVGAKDASIFNWTNKAGVARNGILKNMPFLVAYWLMDYEWDGAAFAFDLAVGLQGAQEIARAIIGDCAGDGGSIPFSGDAFAMLTRSAAPAEALPTLIAVATRFEPIFATLNFKAMATIGGYRRKSAA